MTISSVVLARKVNREGSNSSLACVCVKYYQQTYTRTPVELGCLSGTIKKAKIIYHSSLIFFFPRFYHNFYSSALAFNITLF